MNIRKFLLIAGLLTSVESNAAAQSCESLKSMALRVAAQAYEEAKQEPELIDQIGLFDVWIGFTGQLMKAYEKTKFDEFVATAKMAGQSLIENKADIVKTTAAESYPDLFGRMTFRICVDAESRGWRN